MLIQVTEEDIDKAKKLKSKYDCPVALAIKRQTSILYLSVGYHKIEVKKSIDQIYPKEYSTPNVVSEFAKKFDNDEKVEPFSFELLI